MDKRKVYIEKLEAQLEKALAEPLSPNYKRLLDDARRKVLSAT